MYPYFASNMKSFPDSFRTDSWTALIPLASLSNTALTSPPFCIEMILNWSSSLTQMRNVFSSLWKIPLPSGQSLSMPATVRFLSPETNKKWSSTSCCLVSSFMPVRGKYLPAKSSGKFVTAIFIKFSTPSLCSLVIPGDNPKPSMLLPTLILQEWTGTSWLMFPTIFVVSMSDSCIASGSMPWYSWIIGSNTGAKFL